MSPVGQPYARIGRRLLASVLLALVLGTSVAQSAPSTTAVAWFDQPLPASEHPIGPIAITAHATAPGGISQVELLIDGTSFALLQVPGTPVLATGEFTWQPSAEGVYWLVVRGRSAGQWGSSAAILVKIGNTAPAPVIASPTPDLSPGTTPTAGSSPTPTAQPNRSPQASSSATPEATPRRSATPRSTPTPTSRPTQTPTARPTPTPTPRPTRSPTPRPTPTPTPRPTRSPTPRPTLTPTPNACTPRAPLLVEPSDFYLIDDPDRNPPAFLWRDASTAQCPAAGFLIQIATAEDLSVVARADLDAGVTRWTPGRPLTDCQAYVWWVRPRKADGSLGPSSETWNLAVFMSRSCGS